MLEIFETNLSEKKPVHIALTKIYGVGEFTAKKICKKLGFNRNQKIENLNVNQMISLNDFFVNSKGIFNESLKKKIMSDKKRLIEIKSYRGLRLAKGFPARGQRTHTNAKTSKKKL